ncbi:30S ribosomal protein S2 [Patescibacteria group bacterium]|nr:MAG: 30S ribosomal protein S2 [Patescibacteria group bacterium]
MANIPSLMELLKTGMHFGHQESRWHPKMKPFIFGARGGIHIINLEITQEKLKAALEYVKGVAARGGTVMFVGTKRQAQEIVKREALRAGVPYVSERWLGGTLTNFPMIHATIKRYRDLMKRRASGDIAEKYTKKEQLMIDREIVEMEERVGGISELDKLPDAVFILDLKYEKTAYTEAITKRVPVIALVDSNVNPEDVAWPIPGNDDAVRAIDMVFRLLADAVLEGKANPVAPPAPPVRVAVAAPAPIAAPAPVAAPATDKAVS